MGDYTRGFEEVFPYYLSIGMSPAQFWDGDPWLVKAYLRAHDMERQRKSEEMWLMGAYCFRAFSTALSNLHFDGKRHRFHPYPEDVIRVVPYTEEEKAALAEQERQKAIQYFNDLARRWEKKNAP